MIVGWFKSEDDWYYLNPSDGAMLSGQWINIDEIYYYLTKSGVMARNVYIKDTDSSMYCWVDADGKYLEEHDTMEPDLEIYGVAE